MEAIKEMIIARSYAYHYCYLEDWFRYCRPYRLEKLCKVMMKISKRVYDKNTGTNINIVFNIVYPGSIQNI